MPIYELHVDETVNRINKVVIKTDLKTVELDALLTKIEKDEITSAISLKRKLEAQGIEVKEIRLGSKPYYLEAKTLEIEELEEPIFQCRACDLTKESIEQAIEELREKMYASIDSNEIQSDETIQVSQDLDVFIVSHMKMQLEGR